MKVFCALVVGVLVAGCCLADEQAAASGNKEESKPVAKRGYNYRTIASTPSTAYYSGIGSGNHYGSYSGLSPGSSGEIYGTPSRAYTSSLPVVTAPSASTSYRQQYGYYPAGGSSANVVTSLGGYGVTRYDDGLDGLGHAYSNNNNDAIVQNVGHGGSAGYRQHVPSTVVSYGLGDRLTGSVLRTGDSSGEKYGTTRAYSTGALGIGSYYANPGTQYVSQSYGPSRTRTRTYGGYQQQYVSPAATASVRQLVVHQPSYSSLGYQSSYAPSGSYYSGNRHGSSFYSSPRIQW